MRLDVLVMLVLMLMLVMLTVVGLLSLIASSYLRVVGAGDRLEPIAAHDGRCCHIQFLKLGLLLLELGLEAETLERGVLDRHAGPVRV